MLAGGIGSRFWPASTPERPKQLLALGGSRPLIEETVERALELAPVERLRILAGEHLAGPFSKAMPELPDETFWIEPRARGTAPVLAWAAWKLAKLDPDAVMVSLHADHLIRPVDAFVDAVRSAVEVARRDELLLSLGARPSRVETAYGHIEKARALEPAGAAAAFRVNAFHEKPDAAAAAKYMQAGCLWNTGIFVWKASVLLEELRTHAPGVADPLPLIDTEGDAAYFDAAEPSVIDRAAMERSDRVGVVETDFAWDDLGSWEALSRSHEQDADGNVRLGSTRIADGRNNIVYADGGEVVVLGVDDLIVVQSGGKTLVMPRARGSEMKELLADAEDR
ncbi:MAG: sugar phosphate nucleotidyltransferase [Gemmatimonadota bacterium]